MTTKKKEIGYALSRIDDDEWSWSVEELRDGEHVWGIGSDILADGCERSKREAVAKIREQLALRGETTESATRIPF